MADVYCSCGHERRQHDGGGCTWGDPDGKNRCPVTYMDLSPRAEPPPKKKR